MDGSASAVLIGATSASYTYTIKKSGEDQPWKTVSNVEPRSEFLDTLSVDCGREIAKEIVEYLKDNTNGALTIQAVITLPYPTIGTYFPGRSTDDAIIVISASADSRVATATTQLSITTQKKAAEDINRYYTQNPSTARLTFNTYDGDGTGDSTRKLGINPSDETNDLDGMIYTNGVYDYSNVDADILSRAKSIKYTLELFQKGNDGNYDEGSPLTRIDEYLPSVTVTEGDQFSESDGNGIKTLTRGFTINPTGIDSISINIRPLTGTEFEGKGFIYANYKVHLTAVLLDESGEELSGTKALDYIIYTNARIYQKMIQQNESSLSSD